MLLYSPEEVLSLAVTATEVADDLLECASPARLFPPVRVLLMVQRLLASVFAVLSPSALLSSS